MKFVTVRDLRNKSAQIWNDLPEEQEMVVTHNGRPIAILTAITENNFEASLNSIRKARLIEAISSIQQASVKNGRNQITPEEIDQEINEARKALK